MKNDVYERGVKLSMNGVKVEGFTLRKVSVVPVLYVGVYTYTPLTALSTHKLYTFFTQVREALNIEALPNSVYLFTNHIVEFDSFFNLLNRVNSSGVVFTAKFSGNFREAKV